MTRLIVACVAVTLTACAPTQPDRAAPTPPSSSSPSVVPTASGSPRAAPEPSVAPSFRSASPTTSPPASPPPSATATYAFPIVPVAAASYGRAHHDYPATDVFAACGTDVVAITAGTVDEISRTDDWDPAVDDGATRGGLSISIVGDDGVRYYGSHFAAIAPGLQPGARVEPGQALGTVGNTGSARPTPCHLHLGLSPPCGQGDWEVRRGVIAPWPYLDAWRDGTPRSPAEEVAGWAEDNRDRCPDA